MSSLDNCKCIKKNPELRKRNLWINFQFPKHDDKQINRRPK